MIFKKISRLSLFTVTCFVAGMTITALAQENETPPQETEAFNPGIFDRMQGIFVEDTGSGANNAVNDPNADPCPQPRSAYGEEASDLKQIQEDITRFTLCVQRAQLLERLNSLALENSETINSQLEAKIESMAAEFTPELPEMVIPAMPSVAPSNNNAMDVETRPRDLTSEWTIMDIQGQSGALKATLQNSQNNIVHVRRGEMLPDKETRITAITNSDVTISRDGLTTKLNWE